MRVAADGVAPRGAEALSRHPCTWAEHHVGLSADRTRHGLGTASLGGAGAGPALLGGRQGRPYFFVSGNSVTVTRVDGSR
jgi:hypothetical protein